MHMLSSTMPMNSISWEGPIVLEDTMGALRDINTCNRVLKLVKQANFYPSAMKKLSRM